MIGAAKSHRTSQSSPNSSSSPSQSDDLEFTYVREPETHGNADQISEINPRSAAPENGRPGLAANSDDVCTVVFDDLIEKLGAMQFSAPSAVVANQVVSDSFKGMPTKLPNIPFSYGTPDDGLVPTSFDCASKGLGIC